MGPGVIGSEGKLSVLKTIFTNSNCETCGALIYEY